jgi:hypothetical protein
LIIRGRELRVLQGSKFPCPETLWIWGLSSGRLTIRPDSGEPKQTISSTAGAPIQLRRQHMNIHIPSVRPRIARMRFVSSAYMWLLMWMHPWSVISGWFLWMRNLNTALCHTVGVIQSLTKN